jgi:hypothetical protein
MEADPMSFASNKNQQISVFDGYNVLSERTRKYILDSWANSFANDIFPAINEERFSVLYSENSATRPNTPVNVIIGSFILKELLVLTDDEVLGSVICDTRFQYALHTTSFAEQPLSDRSISRFRNRCYTYEQETGIDLIKDEIVSLSAVIAKTMKINPCMKRMDSLMIASNCKKMTRLEILYTCMSNMVKAIHRIGEDTLLIGIEHYLDEDDHNKVIYHNKSDEYELEEFITDSKIQQVINDATKLLAEMREAFFKLPEYKLLHRAINEQSDVSHNGTRKAKDGKDISPDSLQNPSDPDATFREKAGKHHKGYVGHVVEDFDGEGNSVITDYSYESNTYSDSTFCKETIENIGKTENTINLMTDGTYGGTENQELAAANNINLIVTGMVGRPTNEIYADFIISEDGKTVITCPAGNKPIKCNYNPANSMCRVVMERNSCSGCPNRDNCKVKFQKKSAIVNMSNKMVQRAKQMKLMKTDDYILLSHTRNGVEAIQSVLRRKYHVDEMPVMEKIRSKLFFGFKIMALNCNKIKRYFQKQRAKSAILAEIA